jgi:hypothetical protein
MGFDRYLKASNKRPAKKLADGTAVIATNTTHGPTQSRCLRCHGMCGPATALNGQSVMRCSSCGYSYTLRKM